MVPGVTLVLTCAGMEPRVDLSNETGQFRFADVFNITDHSTRATSRGQPRERQLWRLHEQRASDVPWQIGIRLLRMEHTMSIWLVILLAVAVIGVLVTVITRGPSSGTGLHINH